MKNKVLNSLILVTGLLLASSAGFGQTQSQTQDQTRPNQSTSTYSDGKYTCPVHSEVVQDQPGTCPKCGRTLVLQDKSKGTMNQNQPQDRTKGTINQQQDRTKGTMNQDKSKGTWNQSKDSVGTKVSTYPSMQDTSSTKKNVK